MVFFRFSMVVAGWLVIGVVVPIWLWECDCFDLFQNLGMGICLFQFGFGDVVVLICFDGLLLFCLVDRGVLDGGCGCFFLDGGCGCSVWMVDTVVLFG